MLQRQLINNLKQQKNHNFVLYFFIPDSNINKTIIFDNF